MFHWLHNLQLKFELHAFFPTTTDLWRSSALGQAQFKMILHSSEEVLETFSGAIQKALKQELLVTQIKKEVH